MTNKRKSVNHHPTVRVLVRYVAELRSALLDSGCNLDEYTRIITMAYNDVDTVKRAICADRHDGQRKALELQIALSQYIYSVRFGSR